ncbi:bonus isoform c-related [Anaeramoeba ignava]|uniref:Bonus isoform c-related n=1 Tax=Anaeramoeba ignava TaxID=1746090 RepID=A0A9Q0R9L4_ANAIG|nr:bonus isoform c-related [Anaeramoeba ignava]|eukprot:Anaeramoba_ignava/a478966_524.p1 GENE.a478966_524~~a478966_524.p1  ORF type:complete len:651 (-),score=139.05 a478966_524:1607-3559(-)
MEIEKIIRCAECNAVYQENAFSSPLCQHSFCGNCFMKMKKEAIENNPYENSNETVFIMECPVCHVVGKIQEDEEMYANRALSMLAKTFTNMPFSRQEKSQLCEECEAEEATERCEECGVYLCKKCGEKTHSFQVLKSHHRVPYNSKNPEISKENLTCPLHPNRMKEYFCTKCNMAICVDCIVLGEHREHDIVKLEHLAQGAETRVSLALTRNASIINQLESKLSKIRSLQDSLGDKLSRTKLILEKRFIEAYDALENRQAALVQELDDVGYTVSAGIQRFLNSNKRQINVLTLCKQFAQQIIQINNPMVLHEFENILEKILSTEGFDEKEFNKSQYEITAEFESVEDETLRLATITAPKFYGLLGHQVLEISDRYELPEEEMDFFKVVIKSGGVLTVKAWNGTDGGCIRLNIRDKLVIESGGKIDLTGLGYRGGEAVNQATEGRAKQGESHNGKGGDQQTANNGGGGGGLGTGAFGGYGGGGGGYGTKGKDAGANTYSSGFHPGATGGDTYGDEQISTLYRGSGGGSGHPYSNGQTKGKGGNGGGALLIRARMVINDGEILCDGEKGEDGISGTYGSGGGGGSGGSILIFANLINNGKISALGGKGGVNTNPGYQGICSNGGDGGDGRIALKGILKGNPTTPNAFLLKKK